MPVAELTSRCREETAKFRRGEPSDERYCFELIRRAVCARDQAGDRRPAAETRAVGRRAGQDLWSTILRVLPEEVDRRVLYLSFASELEVPAIAATQAP